MIEQKIREQWSPEQVSGWLKKVHQISLGHERIYLHIWDGKRNGGDLFTHLRRGGKKYQKRSNGKRSRGIIKDRVGIEKRPRVVEDKARIGDWEIDSVIGKGHSGALVTIVERATQFALSKRVDSKGAKELTQATIALLRPYAEAVHSITADNGKEFAYQKEIARALEASVYFARPYHSWERGLNENTNGLLRQYWPKCTDFKKVSHTEVDSVIKKLNRRPRKTLKFTTPEELKHNHLAAIAV
jgi:IS30 family transposase